MSLGAIDLKCEILDWILTLQMNLGVEELYHWKAGKSCYLGFEI